MNLKIGLSALVATAAMTSVSSASIYVFNQQATWETFSAAYGSFIFTENFNTVADGSYSSPFAGTTGPVNWSASASSNLVASGGVLSTATPGTLTFSFTGAPLNGVGGNFFATDGSFNPVSALVFVTLGNGTSYAGVISSSSTFTGFYSTSSTITSISIQAISPSIPVFATVDNMKFATVVPAPGAVALLGLAGLVGGRRRR